jgi:outer membrane protein TolC
VKRIAIASLLVFATAHAAPLSNPDLSDLPPSGVAMQAIEQAVDVQAARWGVTAEEAERDRLVAGEYETNVELVGQQRRVVSPEPSDRFGEWGAGLKRPIRLPDKARLDGELGAQRVDAARASLSDSLHETGRQLLARWFDWVRASLEVEEWERQAALLSQELNVVDKRIAAGDAARLERLAAEATLAQSRASLTHARGKQEKAASVLRASFPALTLPRKVKLATPQPVPGDAARWGADIVSHSHAVRAAQADSRRWRTETLRQGAYETPDPTVGVHYGHERSGEERILGLSISVPLPGDARGASTRAARAQAESANAREAAETHRASVEATGSYLAAVNAYDAWRESRSASDAMSRNAESVSRAYAAGESGINEVLVARRQAGEASLAARLAQADAREAYLRLLIDAHQLWAFDDHGPESAAAAPTRGGMP